MGLKSGLFASLACVVALSATVVSSQCWAIEPVKPPIGEIPSKTPAGETEIDLILKKLQELNASDVTKQALAKPQPPDLDETLKQLKAQVAKQKEEIKKLELKPVPPPMELPTSKAGGPGPVPAPAAETSDFPMAQNATLADIQKWVLDKNFKDKGSLIQALPEELRGNFIIMSTSESSQPANPENPRILLQSNDARTVLAFNTRKDGNGQYVDDNIEIIRFNDKTKKPEFGLVQFNRGKKIDFHANPSECSGCHGNSLRWNWDPYDSWANQLPFNKDKLYKGSAEETLFKRLLVSRAEEPAIKALKLPKGVTLKKDDEGKVVGVEITYAGYPSSSTKTGPDGKEHAVGGEYLLMSHPRKGGDEGQGVALFDHLTPLNAERVKQMVKESPNFERFKFAFAAALKSCFKTDKDVETFYSEGYLKEARKHFEMGYEDLVKDTNKRRHSMPEAKFELQKENMRKIIVANAAAEGKTLTPAEIETKMWDDLYRRGEGVATGGDVITDREIYSDNRVLTALRYALEPEGVAVDEWSLSNGERMRTYTFADLFSTYQTALADLVRDDKDLKGIKTCEELAKASQTAYASYGATPQVQGGMKNTPEAPTHTK